MSLRLFLSALILCGVVACDDPGEDDSKEKAHGNGPGGEGNISGAHYGKLQILASTKDVGGAWSQVRGDCDVQMDIYAAPGSSCVTPLSITGYAGQVDLTSSESGGVGPARLMSEAEEDQAEGEIFPGAPFAMDTLASNFVGNNTLFEEYTTKRTFDGVAMTFAYLKHKVFLKSKYVTMLLPSYSQPFAEQAKSLCGFSDSTASQQRYVNMDLLPGMSFQRGDYLFCVKDSEAATCSATDFQWLDTANNTLVSSRPSAPRQSSYLKNTEVTCSRSGGDRYDFNFSPAQIYATISTGHEFKLYGDFSNGELSNQWPGMGSPFGENENDPDATAGDPFVLYTYEKDGQSAEGSELVAQLNFDKTDAMFINGLNGTEVDAASLGEVLLKLEIKSQWVHDQKSDAGVVGGWTSHYAGMSVVPTITISGGRNRPRAKDEL